MRHSTARIRGLRIPRPIIFIHGWWDRRRSAAHLDPDSGVLTSAYLSEKRFLFDQFCQHKIIGLETTLAANRTEAESLMLELRSLPVASDVPKENAAKVPSVPRKLPATLLEAQEIRVAARNNAMDAQSKAQAREECHKAAVRRQEVLQRLVEIRERMRTRERVACEELEATACALKACFCTYGRGVLLKPVCPSQIPSLEYDLSHYRTPHNDLKTRIDAALKEEN